MHSADDSEFWSALLEKAYAKINGCYNNLSGGTQSEAMEDLTGGVCETIQLDPKNRPKDLLQMMLLYEKRCCLMGCSIDIVTLRPFSNKANSLETELLDPTIQGDCWLLAVVSSISSYPQLFDHVVPKEQTLQDQQTYVGVFRVRFWRFGQWVEVLVDDRLPVYRGTTRLAFMHSADDSEFWSALLEKAYAKINGCYNNLSGGTQSEAMEDLTGGVCETIQLDPKNRPKDLLQMMLLYEKRCCLMGCSIDSQVIEAKMENGLIAGHAYSVTGVRWSQVIEAKMENGLIAGHAYSVTGVRWVSSR
ncbi:hypothetical protein AHF37_06850 [Paragonimus kellicotti]|nr:hypothetical protein AHF37_06850 [Paragonimus kellicotti]